MPVLSPFENYFPVDADDFDEAAGALLRLADDIEDTYVPMQQAKAIAVNDMRKRFITETQPNGYKWVLLSEVYARRRGADHPILDDRGTKINPPSRSSTPGDLRKKATQSKNFHVDGNSIFYSTNDLPDYWRVHQFGSIDMRGSGRLPAFKFNKRTREMDEVGHRAEKNHEGGQGIPARPFIGLSEYADDDIVEIFDKWFNTDLHKSEQRFKVSSSGHLHHMGPKGQFGKRVL